MNRRAVDGLLAEQIADTILLFVKEQFVRIHETVDQVSAWQQLRNGPHGRD